jgi:peptidoglycan/LPS O-acetylase OafA/YrhL
VLVRDAAGAMSVAVAALAATALLFTIMGWQLNTWVGAPALTRVLGEFLCGAALCRAVALSKGVPRYGGDLLGAGAFAGFIVGASIGMSDFALVALLAICVLGTAMSGAGLAALLGSRPLVWLGEISYSIYMVHFPILISIRRLWEWLGFARWDIVGKAFALLITDALVIALAALLFYMVERPARLRLRDRMGILAPV